MLLRLIIFAAVVYIGYLLMQKYRSTPINQRKKLIWQFGLYFVSAVALILAFTGRIHWVGAAFASALPLLSRLSQFALNALPFLRFFNQGKLNPNASATSSGKSS